MLDMIDFLVRNVSQNYSDIRQHLENTQKVQEVIRMSVTEDEFNHFLKQEDYTKKVDVAFYQTGEKKKSRIKTRYEKLRSSVSEISFQYDIFTDSFSIKFSPSKFLHGHNVLQAVPHSYAEKFNMTYCSNLKNHLYNDRGEAKLGYDWFMQLFRFFQLKLGEMFTRSSRMPVNVDFDLFDVEINRLDFRYNLILRDESECEKWLRNVNKHRMKHQKDSSKQVSYDTTYMMLGKDKMTKWYLKWAEFSQNDLKKLRKFNLEYHELKNPKVPKRYQNIPKSEWGLFDISAICGLARRTVTYEMTIRKPYICQLFTNRIIYGQYRDEFITGERIKKQPQNKSEIYFQDLKTEYNRYQNEVKRYNKQLEKKYSQIRIQYAESPELWEQKNRAFLETHRLTHPDYKYLSRRDSKGMSIRDKRFRWYESLMSKTYNLCLAPYDLPPELAKNENWCDKIIDDYNYFRYIPKDVIREGKPKNKMYFPERIKFGKRLFNRCLEDFYNHLNQFNTYNNLDTKELLSMERFESGQMEKDGKMKEVTNYRINDSKVIQDVQVSGATAYTIAILNDEYSFHEMQKQKYASKSTIRRIMEILKRMGINDKNHRNNKEELTTHFKDGFNLREYYTYVELQTVVEGGKTYNRLSPNLTKLSF